MKKNSTRFQSLYWQQFRLTAGVVLLTILLLAGTFYALSYRYLIGEKRSEMEAHAQTIAELSAEFLTDDGTAQEDKETALRRMVDVAGSMTDVSFLICNQSRQVVLTTDKNLAGKSITIPETVWTEAIEEEDGFNGYTTMEGVYSKRQFAVSVPMTGSSGENTGIVLAVIDGSQMLRIWHSYTGLFLAIAVIVLLVAFVASSVMSMRQIQPISEMVRGTRAYGAGNFDIRIADAERGDEIGELARSFNAMADSLEETERQRRDFISNISHELKTPMTTIAGYTDGILDGTISRQDERRYLQIISDECHRLTRLVRRMLDISRIQSQEMRRKKFDLCESMRIALLSMEHKIIERNLDVEADIPEESVFVRGDNELITQVIYNLLENGTKFAVHGSTLYLGLALQEKKAVVTVRNTGPTIPAEEIPQLFERFHKSDKSRSMDKDGYGLGLYVVKTILTQHKEKISVTSENGVTAFSFTMQLADNTRREEQKNL